MSAMMENETARDDHWRRSALALVDRQRTLVLATSASNYPWAAPVYYVFIAPAFYFFSSPQSRHMEQALGNNAIAATLFAESDKWKNIEGIQMIGRIRAVQKKMEQLRITHLYLNKFPMAGELLTSKGRGNLDLSAKVRLYAFYPSSVYYMNNQMGFGSRIEISLG